MPTAGVLNVDKPAGTTSFGVVRRLRSLTGQRAGHAGTLDPLATGVLPVLLGSATRLAAYAHRLPKTYVAEVHLGFTTQTDDAEGERMEVADAGAVTASDVRRLLSGFVGEILQEPPAFSAVKLAGQRAYRRARRGEAPVPAGRLVTVHEAQLLDFQPGHPALARVKIVCGSGTYMRALARDLGRRLGVGGYLGSLQRTAYGNLQVGQAVSLAAFSSADDVAAHLLPPEAILPEMQQVRLNLEQEAQVRQGRSVRVLPEPADGELRAHDESGRLVALGKLDPLHRTFVPGIVLAGGVDR